MGSKWSSLLESTRPPNGSSRFVSVGARRVFASSKNTCYLRGHRPCFSHRSHPGRLVPGGLKVEAVSEAFLSETLVVSPSMASGEMALFLLQNISGRRAGARR